MVPRTSDGRVLFVIPWHGHAVAGTTDTPVDAPSLEPRPFEEEIEFMLETAARYFTRPPTPRRRAGRLCGPASAWSKGEGKTSALSRDHVIHVDSSGLLTITGGKWTTYRHMAEDCVDHAITLGRLRDEPCPTKNLQHPRLRARTRAHWAVSTCTAPMPRRSARWRRTLRRSAAQLHPDLPYIAAEVVWAARDGDGAHRGRCARAPHPRAVSQRPRGNCHGRAGGKAAGRRIGPR